MNSLKLFDQWYNSTKISCDFKRKWWRCVSSFICDYFNTVCCPYYYYRHTTLMGKRDHFLLLSLSLFFWSSVQVNHLTISQNEKKFSCALRITNTKPNIEIKETWKDILRSIRCQRFAWWSQPRRRELETRTHFHFWGTSLCVQSWLFWRGQKFTSFSYCVTVISYFIKRYPLLSALTFDA